MMWMILAVAIGLGTGVLAANARTPATRIVPVFSALALGTGFIITVVFATEASPWLGYVYLLGLILGQTVYAAWVWVTIFPEARLTYRQILGYEFTHPNRVQQQYAAMLADQNHHRDPIK